MGREIVITKNQPWSQEWAIGGIESINGFAVRGELRVSPTDPTMVASMTGSVTSLSERVVKASLLASVTDTLTPGRGMEYIVQIYSGATFSYTVERGPVLVKA